MTDPGDNIVPASFLATLVGDVIAIREQCAATDDQSNRRNLVRATLAAVEGMVWLAREHVHDTSRAMGELSPLASMALREQSYLVTDKGDVVEQVRFVTLTAMIRLITKQAASLSPDLRLGFDNVGWQRLQQAIAVRNRITHPKSATDLFVRSEELKVVADGLRWTLASVKYVMAATTAAYRLFVAEARAVVDALAQGDPRTWQEYQDSLAAIYNED